MTFCMQAYTHSCVLGALVTNKTNRDRYQLWHFLCQTVSMSTKIELCLLCSLEQALGATKLEEETPPSPELATKKASVITANSNR